MDTLTVLGTGAARALHYYNTCFMLQGPAGGMLVDGGGGNGILRQLESAGISLTGLTDIFVTHEHIDHSLGIVWLVRMVSALFLKEERSAQLHIRCHEELAEKLRCICRFTLSPKQYSPVGSEILFIPVHDGETLPIAGHEVTFFDTRSTKARQYGFHMESPEGQRIVCTGDEPCRPASGHYLDGTDWLLHEAFCLEEDAPLFRPHDIGHGTVKEAALLAESRCVRNLVLWHTEDSRTVGTRKRRYTEEACSVFHGNVHVPDDLEVLDLNQPDSLCERTRHEIPLFSGKSADA